MTRTGRRKIANMNGGLLIRLCQMLLSTKPNNCCKKRQQFWLPGTRNENSMPPSGSLHIHETLFSRAQKVFMFLNAVTARDAGVANGSLQYESSGFAHQFHVRETRVIYKARVGRIRGETASPFATQGSFYIHFSIAVWR